MALIKRHKRMSTALGTVLALAIAGAAFAYFSSTGSGTGTGSVGASSSLVIHGNNVSALYPGTSSTVSFTVDNPGQGSEKLSTVHLGSVVACNTAFTGTTCPSGHEITTCESVETGGSDTNTANFYMADVASGQTFSNGNGQSVTATGTLKMNDLSSNQDSCQNVNLLLNFTST